MRSRCATTAVALLLTLLAGCGANGAGSDDGSVTLWMYPVIADQTAGQTYWDDIEKDFERRHSGLDLNIEMQPWESRLEKVSTALASGTGPDIVLLTPEQIHQFHEDDTLRPVDDLLDEGIKPFDEAAVDSVTIDGELYAAPIYRTVLTTGYNRKVLEDAGIDPPKTWDDILEAAPALKEKGYYAFDYAGSPDEAMNVTFFPLLWQAGGRVFSDDGEKILLDSPEAVAAVQFLVDLKKAGVLPPDAPSIKRDLEGRPFQQGKAALEYNLDLTQAREQAEHIGKRNFEIGMPLTGEKQVTYGISGLLAVSHAVSDEKATGTALSYLASADVQSSLAAASGFFPARDDAKLPQGDYAEEMARALEYVFPGEIHPLSPQVQKVIGPQVQAALLGEKSPEQAMADAAEEARALVE